MKTIAKPATSDRAAKPVPGVSCFWCEDEVFEAGSQRICKSCGWVLPFNYESSER